jgi:hypothetical protein
MACLEAASLWPGRPGQKWLSALTCWAASAQCQKPAVACCMHSNSLLPPPPPCAYPFVHTCPKLPPKSQCSAQHYADPHDHTFTRTWGSFKVCRLGSSAAPAGSTSVAIDVRLGSSVLTLFSDAGGMTNTGRLRLAGFLNSGSDTLGISKAGSVMLGSNVLSTATCAQREIGVQGVHPAHRVFTCPAEPNQTSVRQKSTKACVYV